MIAAKADDAAAWLAERGYFATAAKLKHLVTYSGWREVKAEQVGQRAIDEGQAHES